MPTPSAIQSFIDQQADAATTKYDDLRAVVFNGTLKRSPEPSQTEGLLGVARRLLERVGVQVDVVRTVDHAIPPGVWPDMTTQGYERDDFPQIYGDLVEPADIIIIAGPIWLGDQSSQTRVIIERLYAYSGDVNEAGPVVLLRQGRRGAHDRQRGRRQARQRPGALRPAAHRRHRPAAVRRLLERRGRPGDSYSTPAAAAPRTPGRRATPSS